MSKLKISLLDRSLYLKGLLLLLRQDQKIDPLERIVAIRVGKMLGFENKFTKNVIKELMTNKYIINEPLRFSTPDIARCFIKDGLVLSLANGKIQKNELIWLKTVAKTNGLEDTWFDDAVKTATDQEWGDLEDLLEAKYLEWQ